MSLTSINSSLTFNYSGGIQTFTPVYSGTYKLEVWGAQGGGSMENGSTNNSGGKGGYSYGEVYLKKGETIYICVGGKGVTGKKATAAGGYNGGGSGTWDGNDDEGSGGGGGATHIAKMTGTLASIGESNKDKVYIVAGGGGGWYGGYANNVAGRSSGTGGSGYIGGVTNGSTSNGQRAGNGQAKITLINYNSSLRLKDKVVGLYYKNKKIQHLYFRNTDLNI